MSIKYRILADQATSEFLADSADDAVSKWATHWRLKNSETVLVAEVTSSNELGNLCVRRVAPLTLYLVTKVK